MVIAILGLVGFFVALYLFAWYLGWMGDIVCGVGSCSAVQASPYAWVGPVPVPGIGMAGYLLLTIVALIGLQPGLRRSRVVGGLLLGLSTIGLTYSAWLTWIEAFVIHAWCQWCVISAVIMSAIFLASLPEIRRWRRSSLRGSP